MGKTVLLTLLSRCGPHRRFEWRLKSERRRKEGDCLQVGNNPVAQMPVLPHDSSFCAIRGVDSSILAYFADGVDGYNDEKLETPDVHHKQRPRLKISSGSCYAEMCNVIGSLQVSVIVGVYSQ